jgi:hypothetical protein
MGQNFSQNNPYLKLYHESLILLNLVIPFLTPYKLGQGYVKDTIQI